MVGVDITAADVFAMAKQGDEVAIEVVEDTCDYLGLACVNICRVLDPDAILLTGGLSKAEGLVDKVGRGRLTQVLSCRIEGDCIVSARPCRVADRACKRRLSHYYRKNLVAPHAESHE